MATRRVQIPSGSKLGSNFPPIEVMEIGQPGLPGELIIHNGRLFVYGANGETYIDGGLIQTDAILAGSITADKLVVGAQNFSHDLDWSADDEDTISWGAGNLKLADGQEFTINAGSFSDMFDEQSSGPLSPSTLATDAGGIGDENWTNPSNAGASDDSYATVTLDDADPISYYLKATEFGFAIPSDRKILGIKVEVEMNGSYGAGDDYIVDYRARIVKNGVIRTANRAKFQDIETDQYYTYGGEADMWGEQWHPDDVNNTGFGFAIAFEGRSVSSAIDATVNVDHIRITVYYGKVAYIYFDQTSTLKVTNTPDDAIGDGKLLLAIVEKGGVGGRVIITPINSAGTTISGDKIVTGRIESVDGRTYFDLNEGRLIVNDGTDDLILLGKKIT